jgi:hypothetical protein
MTNLQTTKLNRDTRICSFEIENMYTNVPKRNIMNIINNILEKNSEVHMNIQKEIMHILQKMMEQNYFQFDQQYYKQTDRLAVGASTSSLMAETYIQHMEYKQIYPVLRTQQIMAYFRYVDDKLIIYDQIKTNIEQTLNEFSNLQPFIKFTIEKELHKIINFLDLTMQCKDKKLEFSVYRKPTQTNIIIPSRSCHPYEHELSGVSCLLNR